MLISPSCQLFVTSFYQSKTHHVETANKKIEKQTNRQGGKKMDSGFHHRIVVSLVSFVLFVILILATSSNSFTLNNQNTYHSYHGHHHRVDRNFAVSSRLSLTSASTSSTSSKRLFEIFASPTADDETNDDDMDESSSSSSTLEDKMKAWEATDEEVKAATLGGVVPGRSDAFDVGLYIAFPIMVITGLLFAVFPFIMENIDTSSVGPPPMS